MMESDGIIWECESCGYRGLRFMNNKPEDEINIKCKCGHNNEFKVKGDISQIQYLKDE